MQTFSGRLYHPAIGAGLLVGSALVLLVLLLDLVAGPHTEGLLPVLLKALLIYIPAGVVTGRRVRRANLSHQTESPIAPPAFHALVAGLLLTVCHAIMLLLLNVGISPTINWFFVEAISAAILSTVAGLLAGHLRD